MEPRRTSAWNFGSAARIVGAVCALGLGACQQMQVRAVVHDRPLVSGATLETAPLRLPPSQPQGEGTWTGSEQDVPAIEGELEMRGRVDATLAAATLSEISGERPLQLDPDMGPVDLGYALLVDLGAGDAPYDDGVETIHAVEAKRGGFSDTVIQLKWRESIRPGLSITGGASLFREQDLGILDGLGTARFGWATLGIAMRF